jgi:hypothetical protein
MIMKKILIGLGLLSLGLLVNAQQWQFSGNNIYNTNNGFVGIGTTTPLSKLEVNNGNLLIRNFNNTDNTSAIMIAHSINVGNYTTFGTSIGTIYQSAGNNTYGLQFFTQASFATGQTEKMRILGNGYVGIGTLTPAYTLDVCVG